MQEHRIQAEISLGALRENIRRAARLAGKPLCAVVKADAYGHGAEAVARLCEQERLRYLAVATAGEALRLRAAGISMPLLVLGYVLPTEAPEMARAHVTQTIFDIGQARELSAALPAGQPLKVHVKVDTGMGRLGLRTAAEVAAALALPGLQGEGLFTHFATADCPDDPYVAEQSRRFCALIDDLHKMYHDFEFIHCENSGAMVNYRELPGNMARAGLVLYGYPSGGVSSEPWRPAMCFRAGIAQVKRLEAGESVSYGRRFIAEKPCDIAVICCGYADGYHRALSGRGTVLIHGHRAPLIGNICMDMMMADLSDCPDVHAGDSAVLFGADGGETLSLLELAPLANTIPYELLCAVSARVPRVYVD